MIRYIPPPADGVKQTSKYGSIEPLWASQKTRLSPDKVPACPLCKKPRTFEMQIMPQVFDKIKELTLVDWETLVAYTCVNPDCVPCKANKGQFYTEEFGYI